MGAAGRLRVIFFLGLVEFSPLCPLDISPQGESETHFFISFLQLVHELL